jgi:hypothetical protein
MEGFWEFKVFSGGTSAAAAAGKHSRRSSIESLNFPRALHRIPSYRKYTRTLTFANLGQAQEAREARLEFAHKAQAIEAAAAAAHAEAVLVLQELEAERDVTSRELAAVARREAEATQLQEGEIAARVCAQEALEEERMRVVAVQQELAFRDAALALAAEQVARAEEECELVRQERQQALERALALERECVVERERSARLERELEEIANTNKEIEVSLAQATESLLLYQSTSTSVSKASTTESSTTNSSSSCVSKTKSTSRTASTLPEGGEVAEGVGVMVTINSKEKETVKSLQTTIKEKETQVIVITAELRATKQELKNTQDYWKAAQGEANNMQTRLRNEQTKRANEEQARAAAAAAAEAMVKRERSKASAAQQEARKADERAKVALARLEALEKENAEAEVRVSLVMEDMAKQRETLETERDRALKAQQRVEELEEAGQTRAGAWDLEKAAMSAALREARDDRDAHSLQVREVKGQLEKKLSESRQECGALEAVVASAQSEFARKERLLQQELARSVEQAELDMQDKVERQVSKRQRQCDAKERLFKSTVTKLLSAEEALESSLTCMVCLTLMKNPVTLVPCGHSLCSTCARSTSSANYRCGECGPGGAVTAGTNQAPIASIPRRRPYSPYSPIALITALTCAIPPPIPISPPYHRSGHVPRPGCAVRQI